MATSTSYVGSALVLFAPRTGLDTVTASRLLDDQLTVPGWRAGFERELRALQDDAATDWIAVVREVDDDLLEGIRTRQAARELVDGLLAPFRWDGPGD